MKQEFGLTPLQPLEANANPQFSGFGGFSWQDGPMTSAAPHPLIWTGTYTPDGGGRAEGIGALSAHPDGSLEWLGTAAKTDSPSFVAIHPTVSVVYAVAEQRKMIRAFRRTGNHGLVPLGDPQPSGEATCHVAVDPQGRFLTAACWGDGQVLLYELNSDGGITARFPALPSVDPHASQTPGEPRQSRAHASLMLQDGRIMTTDLGHDTLRIWEYVPGSGLIADHEVALPFGSGPRHLVQHASGNVFVVSEYSIEVFVVRPEAGTFELVFRGPATSGGSLPDDSAAEISLGEGGRHVYVGVRGSNLVSVLEVGAAGTELVPAGDFPSGGDWPRHHLVSGRWLHVAHERSDNIATFELDPVTGLPGPMVHNLETPSPTALVPGGNAPAPAG
jgi:6-phosphogluconolactonase (cycloisomerase 2 family)